MIVHQEEECNLEHNSQKVADLLLTQLNHAREQLATGPLKRCPVSIHPL
jgi:hypothetical protein